MGDLMDQNQNKIGMDSLTNVLEKCEAIRATRSKDITFGGQLLTDVEKNFIVYDGTSQLTDVWLPFTTVGGKITPDFEKLEKTSKEDMLNLFKTSYLYKIDDTDVMAMKLLKAKNNELFNFIIKNFEVNV